MTIDRRDADLITRLRRAATLELDHAPTASPEEARELYASHMKHGPCDASCGRYCAMRVDRERLFAWVRERMTEGLSQFEEPRTMAPPLLVEFQRAAMCEAVAQGLGESFDTVGAMRASWVGALCEAAGWPS